MYCSTWQHDVCSMLYCFKWFSFKTKIVIISYVICNIIIYNMFMSTYINTIFNKSRSTRDVIG